MKIKKIMCLAIVVILLFSVAGCNSTKNLEKLPSPIAVVYKNQVSWNKVENCSQYEVFVDGTSYIKTEKTFVTLEIDDVEHEVYVVALGDGTIFTDSDKSNIVKTAVAQTEEDIMLYNELDDFSWDYDGMIDEDIEFVSTYQLKREFWWRELEKVFSEHRDDDGGYRAEFWGKLLRGGVDTYKYNHDEELYEILQRTVINILEIQESEPEGRLSGFSVEHEFTGWDLRSHYYTFLGFVRFYEICHSEELKQQILHSLNLQVEYVMNRIGSEKEGKIEILTTSPDWGGATSANMLGSLVKVYNITKNEKILDFCKYIIDTGGSSMLSDSGKTIFQSAADGDPMYTFGCRKFYEVNIIMEGVLDYYKATGDQKALQIALGFYKSVQGIETTVIGSCAVDVEEAAHSTVEQANPDNLGRMNETCVQTTWLRYCLNLFEITGDPVLMDNIETMYYNFGQGIIDKELHNDWPIFSYSPLSTMARADIYSGTAFLDDAGCYCQSCCVLSGVVLMPTVVKAAVLKSNDGFAVNLYIPGTVNTTTPKGNNVSFVCETNYPVDGDITYTVNLAQDEEMSLEFRIPSWSKASTVKLNGQYISGVKSGEYVTIKRVFTNGDKIELSFDMSASLTYGSSQCSNPKAQYNVSVRRGPLVFARDSRLEGNGIFQPLSFATDAFGNLTVEKVENPTFDSQLQLRVKLADGSFVTLVDYGSAGKTMDDNSVMCCWIPTVDYWSVDYSKSVLVRNHYSKAPTYFVADKHMVAAFTYSGSQDKNVLANFTWRLIKQEDGRYRIKVEAVDAYLTVGADWRITYSAEEDDNTQLFTLVQCGLNKFKLEFSDGNVLSQHDNGTIYIYTDINHPQQYWSFETI